MKLSEKNDQDFWSGVMFAAFGAAFAWGAVSYDMGRAAAMGPGWFPLALGCLLLLIGVATMLAAVISPAAAGETRPPVAWKGCLLVLLAVAAFAIGLPRLGVVLSVVLMVLIAGLATKERRPVELAFTAALLAAICYGIFVRGLGVPLPVWPAGIGG